jgi:hypothetical protein
MVPGSGPVALAPEPETAVALLPELEQQASTPAEISAAAGTAILTNLRMPD